MKTVIEMAREAGIDSVRSWKHAETPAVVLLERFAELVLENYRRQSRMTWAGGYAAGAAAEREACAKVCDGWEFVPGSHEFTPQQLTKNLTDTIATQIRARRNT